jgi:uncharacterized protein (DUF58 family)
VTRFDGALLAALALAAAGVASGQRALFVAAAMPLAYAAVGALSTPADPGTLRVERTLSNPSPLPGDHVTVTLEIENAGEQVLPDARVADGVPRGLRVVGGETAGGFALPAGESATLKYTVVADRGRFPFENPTVRVRGAGAARSRTERVPADGTDSLVCRVTVADLDLRQQTTAHTGSLPTDTGGPGIEFHSTRDYQHGDPVSRIDWRQYAKTGDLTTVNYRERRAAAVVLAVDARDESDVAGRDDTPSGAALSAYAAAQAVEPLESAGHQVGVAVFGIDDPVADVPDPAWVPPGTGDAHHARIATLLDAAVGSREQAAADSDDEAERDGDGEQVSDSETKRESPPEAAADGGETTWRDSDDRVQRFAALVPGGTQVVVCSPVLDDFPATLARRLAADDHRVTAVCPDVTATDTPGRTLAAADRVLALESLRQTGANVVDWSPDESLASAVSRAATAVREGER